MIGLNSIDATFQVNMDARPSNYGITHVSWGNLDPSLNWINLYLVRSTTGYPQNPSDGVQVYSTAANDVILTVASTTAGGVVASLTTDWSGFTSAATTPGTLTTYPVQMTSTTGATLSKGQGVTVSNPSVGTFSIVTSGSNFGQYDKLRIPSTVAGLNSATTELGVSNVYHVYDDGSSLASDVNPGYGVTGAKTSAPKYYYSLFVSYYNTNDGAISYPTMNQGNKYLKWKKIGETSSDIVNTNSVIDDSGAVLIKGTKDIIIDHLPKFYFKKLENTYNQDLDDFISLFAFHLDVYIQKNKNIFNLTKTNISDELLLKRLLNEFGGKYLGTSNLTQARTLVNSIIRSFKFNGSSLGVSNYIEAYSGYPVRAISPKNLFFDYNTSSFVDGIGRWYPDPSSTAAYLGAPYYYAYSLGPLYNGVGSTSVLDYASNAGPFMFTSNIDSYVNILDNLAYDQLTGSYIATGSGGSVGSFTFTVSSSQGIFLNAAVYGSNIGTGAIVTNISGTTITVSVACSGSVSGPITFVNPKYKKTVTGCKGSTTLITCDDTSNLFLGAKLTPLNYGPGKFPTGAVVTKINSSTTFTMSAAPLCPLDNTSTSTYNATTTSFAIDTSVNSSMLKITPTTNSATVTFYSGLRRGVTSTSTTASTNPKYTTQFISAVKPLVFKIGDVVTGHSSIPYGTKVVSIGSGEGSYIGISHKLTGTLPAGTTLYFTSPTKKTRTTGSTTKQVVEQGAASTSTDASVDSYPVSPNTPYGFVINFNANGATTATTAVNLQWYDNTGTIISTTAGPIAAPTATSPVPNYNYKNTWYPSFVGDVSPTNAAYVQPVFSITNATTANGYYADAAMLIAPISVISASKSGQVVTMTTSTPHNYQVGQPVSVYTSDTTTGRFNTPLNPGTGYTALISAVSQNYKTNTYSFQYAIVFGSTETVASTALTGYCVSLPALDVASQPIYQITAAAAATPSAGSVRYTCNNAAPSSLVGQTVSISGVTGASTGNFSGSFVVTAVTGTTITVTNSATGTATISSAAVLVPPITVTRHTVFEDARINRLEIQAPRVNLCPNPNGEVNVPTQIFFLGWGLVSPATGFSTTTNINNFYQGSRSSYVTFPSSSAANGGIYFGGSSVTSTSPDIKVKGSGTTTKTVNVNGTPISVSSNNYYAFSAYIKSTEAASFQVQVKWFNNSDTQIGSTSLGTTTAINANEWTRVSLSQDVDGNNAKAPVGAVYCWMYIIKTTVTGASASANMYFDSVLVEKSLTVNPYFDGSFDGYSRESTRDSMWESSAGSSASYLYPNRLVSQGLIDSRVGDMIYYA